MLSSGVVDSPVDLVYLWVDGRDPEFVALKKRYMSPAQLAARANDEQWGDDTRYRNMDEIVYAVRSARRFAPWIRTIHIVITDGQKLPPAVLAQPGVNVVPYSTCVPGELLPLFSSPSIEPFLHRIPGLSDIFLYGNDDYLFWKDTARTYFVTEAGELRHRGYLQPQALARLGTLRQGHMKIANRTAMLLYGRGFDRVYMPEHSFHVFRRDTCELVWRELRAELEPAVALRFRDDARAWFWQMMVDTYEHVHHAPEHVLSLGGAHLSFADVEHSRVMSAYVKSRLWWLQRFPLHTVCFNTIPPSWYDAMHAYFEAHLRAG